LDYQIDAAIFRLVLLVIFNWPSDTELLAALADPTLMEYLYRRLGGLEGKSQHTYLTVLGIDRLLSCLQTDNPSDEHPICQLQKLEEECRFFDLLEQTGPLGLAPHIQSIRDHLAVLVSI